MLKIISRKEALAKGLKRYFTGKPCKRGHFAERNLPKSECMECLPIVRKNHYKTVSGKAVRDKANKKYSTSLKGKIKRRKYYKKYYYNDMKDISKKISHSMESSFKRFFKKLDSKGNRTKQIENILGCTQNQFRDHLEKQFNSKMNWDNYGVYWHIDHIVPKSRFNMDNDFEVHACWHYSNFQPLEAKRNIKKGNKISPSAFLKVIKTRFPDIYPMYVKGLQEDPEWNKKIKTGKLRNKKLLWDNKFIKKTID